MSQLSKLPLKNKNQNDLTNSPMFGKPNLSHKPLDNSQPPQKTSTNPLRLLVGKLVFLDIQNSYKLLNKVKECLNLIEARIADCLSKDVSYVITNREKSNDPNLSPEDKKIKTSPNTLNFLSRSSSLINRTQAILQKASKGSPSTDILATARRFGINVMNISEIEKYVEKYMSKKRSLEAVDKANLSIEFEDNKNGLNLIKDCSSVLSQGLTKNSNHKIYKLKNNFLKFESICKQYKPIYQEFDSWHEINYDALANKCTNSPFQIYFSDDHGSSNCSSTQNDDQNNPKSNDSSQITTQNVFKSPKSSTLTASKPNLTANQNKPTNNRVFLNRASSFSTNIKPQLNIQQANLPKKKPTGYCECCKQRYDNLKQHLTSAQHENFERNQANFKEIDTYINGILNFKQFLIKKNLISNDQIEEEAKKDEKIIENINIDDMKCFAKNFNERRASLGISQHQIVQALNAEFKDPILTETAISKFERLDITPRSSAKVRPVLEKLISDSQLKFGDRFKTYTSNQTDIDMSKKRKRTGLFSPSALRVLNEKFSKNPEPKDSEINNIANEINYDEDLVKNWFNDKQQVLKSNSTVKKFKKNNVVNVLDLLENNTSFANTSLDESSSSNTSLKQDFSKENEITEEPKQTTTPKQIEELNTNQLKKTPPLISSFSLSSPSAAYLFNLNSHNSFTIPVDLPLNSSINHNTSATSKLLASKVDLISGNMELQTIKTNLQRKSLENNINNKSDNSTDLSCIDDVVLAAFVNDFSYEVVQK
ncbi:unnamed protein product [Brachionus calyciflorus]|uniref:Uncharacterized protein n=1 Tax=Brachionus calyciflorus TaxID=104777 RepID=A0A813NZ64_9BILA|nr:unnamed protein product [Brachionus calyciflorus]